VLVGRAARDAHVRRGARHRVPQRHPLQRLGLALGQAQAAQRGDRELARAAFDEQHVALVVGAPREQANEHGRAVDLQHERLGGRQVPALLDDPIANLGGQHVATRSGDRTPRATARPG
jgi:hypothetical protein